MSISYPTVAVAAADGAADHQIHVLDTVLDADSHR